MNGKSPDAFRTISEVAEWLGVNTHVLRFWESKFSQVKPVKRAGGRRYYRPVDMELLGGIQKLLHEDGMTIKGVQKVLRDQGVKAVCAMSKPVDPETDEAPGITVMPSPEPQNPEEFPAPVASPPAAEPVVAEQAPPDPKPATQAEPATALVEDMPMPLFAHRGPESAPPTAPGEVETSPEPEPARLTATVSATTEETDAATTDPVLPSPVIAPLPARDIPLVEALALLRPRQIAPEKLAPIHAGMIALRERMESNM